MWVVYFFFALYSDAFPYKGQVSLYNKKETAQYDTKWPVCMIYGSSPTIGFVSNYPCQLNAEI